ncbi:MAG: helix-turn-helix domain-containing protein [Candidatus Omnitrophota bacterium]|nr:helix-turn-helix domain-containing protein [Candidatus Omnitrophota bacterium]
MFGESIKRLRERKKFTQDDLAGRLGVSRQAICMWELDKRGLTAKMLTKIANVFEVSVDEVVKLQHFTVTGKGEGMITATKRVREKDVEFQLNAPQAKSVVLTGSFNSWLQNGIKMLKGKNGAWKANVNLKPGRYEYKFIVDGQWWTDPSNKNTTSNSYGSHNSLKEISA